MGALLDRLTTASPDLAWDELPAAAAPRLDKLDEASPLYARILEQHPHWVLWLESAAVREVELAFADFLSDWTSLLDAAGRPERTSEEHHGRLRQFRRRHSLRIAYRDVNDLAPQAVIVGELTRLAEFCLRECYFAATEQWTGRLGQPWDETRDAPARFCILGLGKLGSGELNFSSDIDLIYLFEGDGRCRRAGKTTSTENADFFRRVGESITTLLTAHDTGGFLYRTDLRLRPGGETAALVPAISAVEDYYADTQQTWERLALLKARPVAGDISLGAELLENLHSFRYPRHPPSGLLAEIAAMKLRTENEVVGADVLERNVKHGYGGIREIEFLAQTLQLLHAAKYPFLQTHSTVEALRQLARYELLTHEDAHFLEETYWLLRQIEHRLQIEDEQQTHELPADPVARGRVARSLGFGSVEALDAKLAFVRVRVRDHYSALFRDAAPASAGVTNSWWGFFADGNADATVRDHLRQWFGSEGEGSQELTLLVRNSETQPLLRDQVQRFSELVPILDRILPALARPEETLRRIATFAERYGSRRQFLSTCTLSPQFFSVLALLFDRSRFTHELLIRHPGILEEVLRPEILRKQKDLTDRRRELAGVNHDSPADHARWLWLYVRAEQVRAAIGHLLDYLDDDQLQAELSTLAESVVLDVARRIRGAEDLLIVGLGTLGAGELTFGSDLDLVFVGSSDQSGENEKIIQQFLQSLGATGARDPIYEVDLRLRPFGDAGPLVPDLPAWRAYFRKSAQLWERQALTRARVLAGPAQRATAWRQFLDETVYGRGLEPDEAADAWRMRLRVQKERDAVKPPERAFKTGVGGLVDVEFSLQLLQLHFGWSHPSIRTPQTRRGWEALAATGLVEPAVAIEILENHRILQRVECSLRREVNRPISVLPAGRDEQRALARWLKFPDRDTFWTGYCQRLRGIRRAVLRSLKGVVPATTLETAP